MFLSNFRSIFMPNYGVFTNFIFCRCYLKKERKQAEKKQKKVENVAVFIATYFLYVTTQNSSRLKELCCSQQLNVATKLRQNLMAEREILS